MQADCKKPSGIYFGVEQEKNCANKGRKSQDFSSVSGDFITAIPFPIPSYLGGNAALCHCLLSYPKAGRTRFVKVGRSPFYSTLIIRVLSAICLGWTKGYVPVKGTYPFCQQPYLATAIILVFQNLFYEQLPGGALFFVHVFRVCAAKNGEKY